MPSLTKTSPGYTLKSERYILRLVCAHQSGRGAMDVEHGVNWSGVMKIVLRAFEKNNDNTENVKHEICKNKYLTLTGRLRVVVGINDDRFLPGPKGETKVVKISLNDRLSTSVEFTIRKRHIFKSLRDSCLDFLAKEIKEEPLMNTLRAEIPRTLLYTLRKEFYKLWATKRFPRNSINILPRQEAILNQLEYQKEKEERQAKTPALSFHRIRRHN